MRRYVIYGAGAVGGALGAELSLAGNDVLLVARGAHQEALERDGLDYHTPEGSTKLRLPVAASAAQIAFTDDDVVVIATKSQDTSDVVTALAPVAPAQTPIVCAQNGVANEDMALRVFPNVYGAVVVTPAAHLHPGEVSVHASPNRGVLHLGRHPRGTDALADELALVFSRARFLTTTWPDVGPAKYAKLLSNLANAAQAVIAPDNVPDVVGRARAEGRAVLDRAGITYLSEDEFAGANSGLSIADVPGQERPGGSMWQSVARGASGVESDFLNGEIVLLGRLFAMATPVNAALQQLSHAAIRRGDPPGTMRGADFDDYLANRASRDRS